MISGFTSACFSQKAQNVKSSHLRGRNFPNSLVRQVSWDEATIKVVWKLETTNLGTWRFFDETEVERLKHGSIEAAPLLLRIVVSVSQPGAELSRGQSTEALVQVELGLDLVVERVSGVGWVVSGEELTWQHGAEEPGLGEGDGVRDHDQIINEALVTESPAVNDDRRGNVWSWHRLDFEK